MPAVVIDLQVTPVAPRLEVGQALALQAELRLSDGTRNPAQGPMQWRSMTPERVSVDGDGVLHALAVGPARVQVSTSERMLEVAVQVVDAQPDFNQGCRHPELAAGELIFVCPLTRAEADRLALAYDGSARDEDGDYNPFPHDYVVMNQVRARDYCQQLVARGHDDWRLPAARELTALFAAYHQRGEELKLLTEQGWPLYSRLWSSDAPNDDGEAPLLDPGSGELITDLPQEAHGVACVRVR
ncbi:hypothetical protein PY368_02900 [Aeromonas hydrophila]|uniref:hypothetical protein n=1 Tax=Aeromonas hydrophila TaxID=644 RepID=UPI0023E361DC|nr:hypothetical protein [Aeromonas hydrophila]WES93854.1 hypothetical protein PY368_02900 [Aeromonas hydrophila]